MRGTVCLPEDNPARLLGGDRGGHPQERSNTLTHTTNYSLSQWDASDRILRSDFNSDNSKIDAALKALASSVSGKASALAFNTLSKTVYNHSTALAKKGDCLFYTTTYIGSGKTGSGNPNVLSFPNKPMVVYVWGSTTVMTLLQGMGSSWADSDGGGAASVSVTWSGNTVSWYGTQTYSQLSSDGSTYHVLALLQAG